MFNTVEWVEFQKRVKEESDLQLVYLTDCNLTHEYTQFYRGVYAGLQMFKKLSGQHDEATKPVVTENPYPT